jgi:hypothetical protein
MAEPRAELQTKMRMGLKTELQKELRMEYAAELETA